MALEAWALLTLEEAREAVSVTGSAEDYLLESLTNAATLRCEAETGRKLVSRTYTDELFNGTGGQTLSLREFPVTAVSAVSFLTTTAPEVWTAQSLVTYPLVIVHPGKFSIYFRNLVVPWGVQNVKVTYTAGLSATDDLKAACRIVLLDLWKQKDRQLAGIASQSFNGQTVSYLNEPIPKLAAKLLMPYRRLAA